MKRRISLALSALILALLLSLTACVSPTPGLSGISGTAASTTRPSIKQTTAVTTGGGDDPIDPNWTDPSPDVHPDGVPAYSGQPWVALNGNIPTFTADQYTTQSYEQYAPLDSLGRCGVAMACVGRDIMPTEPRGDIASVKPTAWHSVSYTIVSGGSLYNRCHLIGFQLTGENANRQNLITGTRYMNWDGMVEFENMVADYVKETGNHVLYRVTPFFKGNNLLASGVQIEAWSVEDQGAGICFNVYAYNLQPGITIDYATGESRLTDPSAQPTPDPTEIHDYILNTNSKVFHLADCGTAKRISEKNREDYTGLRDDIIARGYTPAGCCKP